jgi:hypothetical protein
MTALERSAESAMMLRLGVAQLLAADAAMASAPCCLGLDSGVAMFAGSCCVSSVTCCKTLHRGCSAQPAVMRTSSHSGAFREAMSLAWRAYARRVC